MKRSFLVGRRAPGSVQDLGMGSGLLGGGVQRSLDRHLFHFLTGLSAVLW